MKKININLLLVACLLMVSSLSFGQLKFGDKTTVGQTLALDNASGVATVELTFNTDKKASSTSINTDSAAIGIDYYNISIQKCGTNKGFQVNVYDEAGSAVVNGDFKCRRYNSYENPVRVKSVESLKAILASYSVNDVATTTSIQNPAHCLFDLPFSTTYDFTDSIVYANKVSDDGLLSINDGVNWHSRDYALDMKTGSQMEIIVAGDASIAFLGSKYSSLSMKAEAKSGNGTFAVDSMSTIVVNDKVDFFTFEYTGSADTLVFTAVADGDQDSDIYLPKVVVSGTNAKDQAFGAWPGKYKQVEYGFNVKFDGSNVENDITFSIDTYDEGNTGATASYELTVYIGGTDASNLVATVTDFYVTGSGLKEVSLASAAGLSPSDFSSKNVYWFLKTAGTGTTIADDSFDPIIIIDNMIVKYNPPAWVIPAAGITANQTLATTVEGVVGDTIFSIPLQTSARLSALNIVNDLQDKTTTPFATFLAEGALMANDGNGNYTVPVAYTLTPSEYNAGNNQWSNAKISVAAPTSGTISDDMMFFFKARVVSGRTMIFRLELDHGTRIWYDVNIKDTPPIVNEGIFYNIIQKSTGLVIGADSDPVTQPSVMTADGSTNQAFEFIPVEGKKNTYNIKNKEGMYFNKSTSNNWTTIFEAESNDLLSEWILNGEDTSSVTLQIVANLENIGEAKSYLSTDDVTSGSNLYCDKPVQEVGSNGEFSLLELPSAIKIAYVNDVAKVMVEAAAQTDSDPIITMLKADDNFEVDVMLVAADSILDLSAYDIVVAQEGFSSSAAIFRPDSSLGIGAIEVPFIYNKAYAMKAGRGFATDATGAGAEVEGTLSVNVSEAGKTSDIFKGIDATGEVKVFNTGAADDGSRSRRKGLQYAKDVVISAEGTLLASGTDDPETATVCINDIPAGATIGSETLKARMITFCMNYGAICANEGTNFTDEGLTLWRNAIYSLAGLDVPAELFDAPEFVSKQEIALDGVGVYPNPVEYNLNVTGIEKGANITIINTVGQVIMKTVANSSTESISVETLKHGIYMMKVEMNGAASVSRFVKK